MALEQYVALGNITISSAISAVSFSSIPNAYNDLLIVINAFGTGDARIDLELNDDTTRSNYYRIMIRGDGSTAGSGSYNENALMGINSSRPTHTTISLMDYSSAARHKGILYRVSDAGSETVAGAMRWPNTSAVNKVNLQAISSSFAAGSTISLYGVR